MKLLNTFFYTILLLFVVTFISCEGEKDIVIIDGNLPIKTSTLFMVGDATPAGWNIDDPTALTVSEDDPLVFIYEGNLSQGEMKCCLTKGNWGAPFIRPLTQGREINKVGFQTETFQMFSSGDDLKWKVTEAGKYKLTFDLRNWTISVANIGQ